MANSKTGNGAVKTETVTYQVERVNLFNYGYEKAGSVKGDPEIYASFLNRIANGDLVEENYKGLTDNEKKERREQIKVLEKQLDEIESSNAKIESDIKEKEKKIDDFRQDLLKIREVRRKDHDKLKSETFSIMKFSINLIILVMLTGYLFFFYVSAAYKALYVDLQKIADNLAQGLGTGSIMPQPNELSEAIRYNYLLFLVPFVFYAFGWAFHVIMEMKQKIRVLYIGLLIAVTFTVDFLLALIISNNTENAKDLMGLATTHWTSSPTFYIILFLGFLVYIIWSILLDSMLREWDKLKVTNNLKRIIQHLNSDIRILKGKLFPIKDLKDKIANYREDISTVMYGNLKKYIEQFSSGWMSYLAPDNMKAVKERCQDIKKDFEEKHGVKPGIVKVIAKRG
jgi:hypothetical protein